MAVFFAVFDRQANGALEPKEQTWEGAKLMPSQGTAPLYKGRVESAKVARVEVTNSGASGIAEVQRAVKHFFPGASTDTPVVVTEAAFLES